MTNFTEKMDALVGEILVHATDGEDQIFFASEPDALLDAAEILAQEWYKSPEAGRGGD